MKKLAVYTTCDNIYVKCSIVALKQFQYYNRLYDAYILSSYISKENLELCNKYNIKVKIIDLSSYFTNIEDRTNKKYPIECYYIFFGTITLADYDYIIYIDGDVYTNNKINIDLDSIKNIMAFETNILIKNFTPISKCKHLLTDVINKDILNKNRFNSGVIIFNCKNVNSNNFFNDIIKLYKLMIQLGHQLCGDDSLFTLYYLHKPSLITIKNKEYNYYDSLGPIELKNIYLFHFIGLTKPWIKDNTVNEFNINSIQSYFKLKWVESLYNNFDDDFIYNNFNEFIYPRDLNINYKFYYYNKELNFGDLITPYINNKYCKNSMITYVEDSYTGTKIISTGSIIRLCNNNTIVYGSGIRDINQKVNNGLIISVRGPLTFNNYNKQHKLIHCAYGDPGLLMPLFYNPPIINKSHELGIIPHYIDYKNVVSMYKNDKVLIINLLDDNIENVINQILNCKNIISSSLHGLIVSDAYKIPNLWIKYDNKIKGDDTKFHDYFKSVNKKKMTFINAKTYKYIAPEILINEIKNKYVKVSNIKNKIYKIYNNMYFNFNGIKHFTKYLYYNNLCINKVVAQHFICPKKSFKLFDTNIIQSIEHTFIHSSTDVLNKIAIKKNVNYIINNELQSDANDFWIIKLVL
jgi:pyruvyltransferase